MPAQIQQIIADRYIDRNQLKALLARNFMAGTYTMKVRRPSQDKPVLMIWQWKIDRWIITAPRALTEVRIAPSWQSSHTDTRPPDFAQSELDSLAI